MYKALVMMTIAGVLAVSGATAEQSARAADEVKIGMMAPLTGNEAAESKVLLDAAKLAIKQVNAAGGVHGSPVKLVIEDTKSAPDSTLAAYEKLLTKDKVAGVVGPFKSALIVAMIPKMMSSGVPTVIGGTNPRITEEHKYMVRFRPDDTIAASAMTTFIKENLKVTQIGVIHDNGAFGKGGANLVDKYSRELGLKVVKREGFNFGTRDFAAPVKSLKDAGAEVMIVYAANYDESAAVMSEWAKQGKSMAYLGSPSSLSSVVLNGLKGAADGAYGVVDMVFGQNPEGTKYANDYRAEYKSEPDPISTYTFDGIKVLAQAMNAVGTDKDEVRDYIFKLKGYKGVMGTYDFDALGNGLHSVSVAKAENGKPALVRVISVTNP